MEYCFGEISPSKWFRGTVCVSFGGKRCPFHCRASFDAEGVCVLSFSS